MKFAKKFLNDLKEIGRLSFFEKNLWVGKSVPEIICDNLEKRGITPEDFTGAVVLTVDEAQLCLKLAIGSLIVPFGKKGPPKWVKETIEMLRSRIEQAEKLE